MLGNLDSHKESSPKAELPTALKFVLSGKRYLTELKCPQGLVLQKMCELQQALKLWRDLYARLIRLSYDFAMLSGQVYKQG